jgi:hypothetical protein
MEDIVNKIIDLYNSPDGSVGAYGHIVFDDDNIETFFVKWCIEEAEKGKYEWICEETRQKSIIALNAILPLTKKNRQEVIDLAFSKMYSR